MRCRLQGPSEDRVPRRRRDWPGEMLLGVSAGWGLRSDRWIGTLGGHLDKGSLRAAAGRAHHRDFWEGL